MTDTETDGQARAEEFEEHRPRLFGLAYRMLGSAAEAEDAVQDAYLRWRRVDREAVTAPGAWLAKVTTNLCLNRLTAARARREEYVGQWLPEPVLTEGGDLGPLDTAQQRESVSLALLVLLERLTPAERAVFVLRESFGYRHREIGDVLGVTEPHARQLYRRARRAVAARPADGPAAASAPVSGSASVPASVSASADRPGPYERSAERARWQTLVAGFLAAARQGDLEQLETLLTEDVVSYADGGDEVNTARRPILGRVKVARYLAGGLLRFASGVDLVPAELNGQPGLVGLVDGQVLGVLALEVVDGRVGALRVVASPEKLRYLQRQIGALSRFGGPSGSPL